MRQFPNFLDKVNPITATVGRCYSFLYQGVHDSKPELRTAIVEEKDSTSILCRSAEPDTQDDYRRFRFDRMHSVMSRVI